MIQDRILTGAGYIRDLQQRAREAKGLGPRPPKKFDASRWDRWDRRQEQRAMEIRAGQRVYFMRAETSGRIKIGTSKEVERRRVHLQRDVEGPLVVLASFPGTHIEERSLHLVFSASRVGNTEWFNPTPGLLEAIASVLEAAG